MENIPTAEELLNKRFGRVTDLMVEFAKLHVQAALKAASKTKVEGYYSSQMFPREDKDEKSILNAYPLEQIK